LVNLSAECVTELIDKMQKNKVEYPKKLPEHSHQSNQKSKFQL
jgi:hypothetical protein